MIPSLLFHCSCLLRTNVQLATLSAAKNPHTTLTPSQIQTSQLQLVSFLQSKS
jgi:hypothetical protein